MLFRKKKKKKDAPAIEGRSARSRLDRRGPKKMAAGGMMAGNSPSDDDDKPVEQAGVLDTVARGAARLFGRGAAAKAPIPGLSRQASEEADKWMPSLRKFTNQEKNWTPEYRARVQKHIDDAKKSVGKD